MSANSITSSTPSVCFPPEKVKETFFQFIRGFISRTVQQNVSYSIKDEVKSPATRVIFTHSKWAHEQICLKIWLRWKDELYDTSDITTCAGYMVDGLKFNRRFAQNVYLGIAPVTLSEGAIQRGRLIAHPEKSTLKEGVEYALVMKYLERDWQLDYLLQEGKLNQKEDMEFLAREVARMHQQLEPSPANMGHYACISSKLSLNTHLFNQALDELERHEYDVEKYRSIGRVMTQACQNYRKAFEQRYKDGHIKRCHGDLKAANLWVYPEKSLFLGLKKHQRTLLALDCVDFNHPEFCHIDPLSDVAMLAADIEMRSGTSMGTDAARGLVHDFLKVYLEETREDSSMVWPLLAYYITEKAMICAYMSILYDNSLNLGKKYLEVALVNAQRIAERLQLQAPSMVQVS